MEGRILFIPSDLSMAPSRILTALSAILLLAAYAMLACRLAAVFRENGKPAWKAYFPMVNAYEAFTLVGRNGWCCLLLLVPVINYCLLLYLAVRLGETGAHS